MGDAMIRQKIYFNDNLILTIIHQNMDKGIENRYISETEDTEFAKLKFVEEYINEIGKITFDEISEGFLENQNLKNPYHSYSVSFKEFINYDKPLLKDNKLTIDMKNFCILCDFVSNKTGYNLIKNPYSIGNTIIFMPNKIESSCFKYKSKIDGIEVKGLSTESITIIKLKYYSLVRETYVINGSECKIYPKQEWSSFDIEVYENGQIVHAEYNISLIKSVFINGKIISKSIKTELKTKQKCINITSSSSLPINVGQEVNSKLVNYFNDENEFKQQLKNTQKKDLYFLGKNESQRAFDIFEQLMDYDCQEVWIFDPYFINYEVVGGIERLRDILKILIKNRNVKKNIVFENKETNVELDNFINKVSDNEIKLISKNFNGLNLEFYGTSEHFHDRFFFFKNKKQISGYLIGTSLNSFGENYSTLIRLKSSDAEDILNKLLYEVVYNKIVNNKSI